MNIFNIKFQGCNIWFSLSKGQNYVQSTTTNSFMQGFSSDTQPRILRLNYLRFAFDIFDKMSDINLTQYQIYQLQRPNSGLHQLKYLNLNITSNMRLSPPCLDQNVNYDATAHNSWQISNSFQFSIAILILGSSQIEIYVLPE